MAYETQIRSDPSPMPLAPAILVLLHKRRKAAFIAYSTNARGRAAVLASSIRHRDEADPQAPDPGELRHLRRDRREEGDRAGDLLHLPRAG